jgi:hypothetical protein
MVARHARLVNLAMHDAYFGIDLLGSAPVEPLCTVAVLAARFGQAMGIGK